MHAAQVTIPTAVGDSKQIHLIRRLEDIVSTMALLLNKSSGLEHGEHIPVVVNADAAEPAPQVSSRSGLSRIVGCPNRGLVSGVGEQGSSARFERSGIAGQLVRAFEPQHGYLLREGDGIVDGTLEVALEHDVTVSRK